MSEILSKDEIWGSVKDMLRTELGDSAFFQWFNPMLAVSYENNKFVLGVPDDISALWIERQYIDNILVALKKVSQNENLKFVIETGHKPAEKIELIDNTFVPESTDSDDVNRPVLENDKESHIEIHNCNSKFVFDTFVVGDGNNFAYSAALAVSQEPGYSYNPLFIYGGTGLGKTHLIQATAHQAVKLKKNFVVEYLTCEEFVNMYIDTIQRNKIFEFRKHFRNVDMLLVDDVQFLANKPRMQEEFFNTFNALYNDNKQIILTSDRSPNEIDGLEARLVSRFDNGLTTDIQPPGLETRMAILRKKQEEQIVKLDDEILYFMANNITSNVRRMEGALIRLTAFASMANTKITLSIAQNLLHPLIMQEAVSKVSVDMIQKKVAEFFDISVKDLTGSKRPQNIAYPRMVAMYLAREMTDCSLPEIGELFGGRTHATVINAVNKIKKERILDQKIEHSISAIQRQLQNC